jgi:anti-sigma factor RsiW
MSDPTPDNFEDPQLKLALRRALAPDPVSDDLKQRIERIVGGEASRQTGSTAKPHELPRRSFIRRPAFRRIAIAAMLLITVVLIKVLIDQRHHAAEHELYLQANLSLFRDMVHAEESVTTQPTTLPVADPATLSRDFSSKLSRNVQVPDFQSQGWTIVWAAVGPIGTQNAAEVCYRHGNNQMLFVSLPASALAMGQDEEDEVYAYVIEDHPLAGVVKTGSLNCCIGDKHLPLHELTRLKLN